MLTKHLNSKVYNFKHNVGHRCRFENLHYKKT